MQTINYQKPKNQTIGTASNISIEGSHAAGTDLERGQNQAQSSELGFGMRTASALGTMCRRSAVSIENSLYLIRSNERGEGLVSFLLIVVAVAVIALYVLGVFEAEVKGKVAELDLGQTQPSAPGN